MSGKFKTICFEKHGPVALVTLNRPRQLNAYNMAMRDELYEVFSALFEDPDTRAMVLSGAGKAFSTGGDVTEFGTAPSPVAARWIRFRRDVWGLLGAMPFPTIAAIHGFTVGGGLEMALLCDITIAASDTRICLPETGLGMIPGVAGTQTASRRLGVGRALDLCLTGRWVDARAAYDAGLVSEVVRPERLLARSLALGRKLARLSQPVVALAKIAIKEGLDLPLLEGLSLEKRLAARLQSARERPKWSWLLSRTAC